MRMTDELKRMFSGANAMLIRGHFETASEIRIRANQPICIRKLDGSEMVGEPVDANLLRRVVNNLMENSLYACENELRHGYFTTRDGYRVGVCGQVQAGRQGIENLSAIGSVCIRIPREAKGCADKLAAWIFRDAPEGLLLLSKPGMGKTTVLRELIRLASLKGYNVGVCDERREIAACREGIPTMDLGMHADVLDGCPKELGIPMLVRGCAPQIIAVDEIGGMGDACAIADALRSGVTIIATAHAANLQTAMQRISIAPLLNGDIFPYCAVLGPKPGELDMLYRYSNGGMENAEGYTAVDHTALLRGCGAHDVQCAQAALR